MEIYTNLTTCPKCNNYYNTANHKQCPFCSGTGANASFGASAPAGVPGSFSPTIDPSMAAAPAQAPGAFSPTVSPSMAQANSAPSPVGVTQPVNNPHMEQSSSQPFSPTVSIMQAGENAAQTEPVVGWLVCIEGPMRGNDYRIHEGYNYIGREIGDIHIRGDQTISRQRHAKIDYDSNGHQYFFSPDEGRNLLRVNDQTIRTPVELHDYDVITVGQTKLLFIGLCGEQFSWKQD